MPTKTAEVTFHTCVQDSQDYGSDSEHMISRVFFSLREDGAEKGRFFANLKQTVDSDFLTGTIEVGPPIHQRGGENYDGAGDHQAFSDCATRCFCGLVGSSGAGICVRAGATNS